eukprot:6461724-Amphidinium_carterae.2
MQPRYEIPPSRGMNQSSAGMCGMMLSALERTSAYRRYTPTPGSKSRPSFPLHFTVYTNGNFSFQGRAGNKSSCAASKVLPDFIGPGSLLGKSLRTTATVNKMTELEDLQVRQLFEVELARDEIEKLEALRAELGPLSQSTRQANKSFVRALDHMMVAGLGKGLLHFKPRVALHRLPAGAKRFRHVIKGPSGSDVYRSCLLHPNGSTEYEWPRQYVNGCALEPLVHIFMDQGSVGLLAAVFLATCQKVRMSVNFDWCHRLVNDWNLSLSHSGLHIVRLEYKLCTTARFGPWGGSANHWQLKLAAEDYFSRYSHRHWIFQIIYDKLCQEDPALSTHPQFGEETHEEMVFEHCRCELGGARMEGNPQLARWWNVEHRSRALRKRRWMLTVVAKHDGVSAFTRTSRYIEQGEDEKIEKEGDGVAADHAEGDGAETRPHQEGGDADGAPASALEACSLSRARLTASQRRGGQILKEVTHLLCDDIGVMLWQGVSNLCLPLEQAFGTGIREMKSAEGRQSHLEKLVSGCTIDSVVASLLHWFGTVEFASSCLPAQCGDCGWSDFQLQQMRVVGQHLVQCLWSVCTELHVSALMYKQPPMQFLRLLDSDAEEVQRCLQEMKMEFTWLGLLEESMNSHAESGEAEQLWRCLLPPHLQWVRESWLRCWECNFEQVPHELVKQLQCYARSHHSTLQVEYTFNECRAQANKSKTHRQSGASLWNTSCYGRTAADFERPVPRVQSGEQATHQRSLPNGLYTQKCCEMSLSEDSLNKLSEKRPSWPDHSPASLKQSAVAWELLKAKEGNYDEMKESWLSLLLEPGTLIMDTKAETKTSRLVTGVTKHGYFWMRPEINLKEKRVHFNSAEQEILFDVLKKPETWKVAKLKLRPPAPGSSGHSGFKSGFSLDIVQSKFVKVPQFAASLGFRHMTCAYLKKLRKWFDLSGSCKHAEAALVTSLVEHVCKGSCDEELLSEAMNARKLTGFEVMLKSCRITDLGKDVVSEAFLDEEGDDGTDLVAMQQWESLQHQKQNMHMDVKTLTKYLSDWMAVRPVGHEPQREGAGSSAMAGTRQFLPLNTVGYTPEEVKPYVPFGSTLSKDKKENRWRLRCKHLPGSGDKSKSYGGRSGTTDFDAMRVLVMAAWAATTAATGVERPFDMHELPAPEGAS